MGVVGGGFGDDVDDVDEETGPLLLEDEAG
jgi:hypothetical protein